MASDFFSSYGPEGKGPRSWRTPGSTLRARAPHPCAWIAIGLGLLAALPCPVRGAGPALTNAPPIHHIIAVENSANMESQREQAADLVSRAMLDGFRGRARIGEIIELWIVEGDQIVTNALPAFRWHPLASIDNSNSAYRYLRALKSDVKNMALDQVIPRLDITNHPAARLLVCLVTSGFDDLQGTPFDETVNRILLEHRGRLREAGSPFVTILAAQEGSWVGQSVTPGDRTPFVPAFPPLQAELAAARAIKTNTPPVRAPQPLIYTNKPKTLTVAEIELKLREAALEHARTSSPPALVTTTPAPSTNAQPTAPLPVAAQPASAGSEPETPAPKPTNTPETQLASTDPTVAAITPSSAAPAAAPVLDPPHPVNTAPAPMDRNPSSALPPPVPTAPWKDYCVGALLLVAALALTIILLRQITHRRHPSLITESWDRRPGPPRETQK